MLPDATRTAQSSMHRGSRTRCIPLASVMGIEPIGRWVWRPDRPPVRTPYDSFLAGESDPGADGRPVLAWCQRFSGCTPRAVIDKGLSYRLLPLQLVQFPLPEQALQTSWEKISQTRPSPPHWGQSPVPRHLAQKMFFTTFPPQLGAKKAITFLVALPCRSAT